MWVPQGGLPCDGIVSGSIRTGREERPFSRRSATSQSKPNSEKIAHREEALFEVSLWPNITIDTESIECRLASGVAPCQKPGY